MTPHEPEPEWRSYVDGEDDLEYELPDPFAPRAPDPKSS